MQQVNEALRAAIAGKPPREQLRAFIRTYLQLVHDEPAAAEVLTIELRQSSKFMKEYENPQFADFLRMLGGIIAAAQARASSTPAIPAHVAARMIFGDARRARARLGPREATASAAARAGARPKKFDIVRAADWVITLVTTGLEEQEESHMKILVPVKRVPDPTQKAKIKDGHIDLTGASWIVNTFDEYAVETALRLTENGEANTRAAAARSSSSRSAPRTRRSRSARRSRWAPTARSTSSRTTSELDALVVVKVLAGDHRGGEARPRRHGQAGRRRRRQPGRPDARRQARLAAGDVRRVDRAARRQGADRRPRGRRRRRVQARAAAGGGHGRPAHRRARRPCKNGVTPGDVRATRAKARACRRSRASWRRRRSRSRRRSSPTRRRADSR